MRAERAVKILRPCPLPGTPCTTPVFIACVRTCSDFDIMSIIRWLVSKTASRNQETRSTRSGEPSVHDLVSKNKTQHHCQPFHVHKIKIDSIVIEEIGNEFINQ